MLSMLSQDIERGEGVTLIDPHGHLAETVLDHIPPVARGGRVLLQRRRHRAADRLQHPRHQPAAREAAPGRLGRGGRLLRHLEPHAGAGPAPFEHPQVRRRGAPRDAGRDPAFPRAPADRRGVPGARGHAAQQRRGAPLLARDLRPEERPVPGRGDRSGPDPRLGLRHRAPDAAHRRASPRAASMRAPSRRAQDPDRQPRHRADRRGERAAAWGRSCSPSSSLRRARRSDAAGRGLPRPLPLSSTSSTASRTSAGRTSSRGSARTAWRSRSRTSTGTQLSDTTRERGLSAASARRSPSAPGKPTPRSSPSTTGATSPSRSSPGSTTTRSTCGCLVGGRQEVFQGRTLPFDAAPYGLQGRDHRALARAVRHAGRGARAASRRAGGSGACRPSSGCWRASRCSPPRARPQACSGSSDGERPATPPSAPAPRPRSATGSRTDRPPEATQGSSPESDRARFRRKFQKRFARRFASLLRPPRRP